jgi:EAL domain-containing protein (putative c-di-GMP-specific phosphodiesterase class I)
MGDSGEGVPHVLLRNADTAMYEAKQNGRGSTVVFDQAMHARLSRAVQIEAGLRLAVERGELTVLYQPIVDLENGQMSSVEALLRWQHPELGSVSPAEFIPIAEDSGHIVAIGEWVLRQACLQWARWQQQDAAAAPAGMSVNLSRVQMQLGNRLLQVVRSALSDAGMPASALQLEITERLVMKDPAAARELMLGMNAMGVRLAMDDFGTGSSSLGCLRDYPFDTIKIDKSFVTDLSRDPHVLAVAHATVNVIENLRMTSVAEGIEDPAEVAMLQAMGCRYGQGYLFARPLAADQLLAVMAEGLG